MHHEDWASLMSDIIRWLRNKLKSKMKKIIYIYSTWPTRFKL